MVVTCILASLITANAQVNTSSLTGLVVDSSGANVPHVTITVTNKATGLTRTDETDGAGYYSFPSLPIGLYTVSVSGGAGFAGISEDVQLDAAQKTRRDFTLRVGSSQETVSVSADGGSRKSNFPVARVRPVMHAPRSG